MERLLQRPAWGRRGREPGRGDPSPFPPAPAPLTNWTPTGPRQTPTAARQPPRHEYTPGGRAGDKGWQADTRRGRGAGGGGVAPPPPGATPLSRRTRSGHPTGGLSPVDEA